MNILMTARWPAGGIRTYFRYVYGRPEFSDFRLALIAPDLDLAEFLETRLPKGRIEFLPCQNDDRGLFRRTRQVLKARDWNLVHSHGFSAGAITEWARLGNRTIPHLMTAHDVFLSSQFKGWKGRLKHWAMNQSFRRMDAIHTVTHDAGQNFLEFFPALRAARIHPILHGVDTDYFSRGRPWNVREQVGLQPGQPVIGFFGRFMAQKGFRHLVQAIGKVNVTRTREDALHVLTWGWGGFVREDYAYVEQQGLDDFFHQMPHTDDMPSAIASMDAVAMPSRWEACGLLGMEVLAAGVPLVATNCIGLREVVEGTPAYVVPMGDVDALAKVLPEAVTPEARQRFKDFQPEAVRRFSVERPARELAALYRSLIVGKT